MGFFFNSIAAQPAMLAKPKTVKAKDLPTQSLRDLGCAVCPRNADESQLESPKMQPRGVRHPLVYLLGTKPSTEDDEANRHWAGAIGKELSSKFGLAFMANEVRSGYVTQCAGDQTAVEVNCCHNRVMADIEHSKPRVIVGIGDAALAWATGVTRGALTHRNSFFPVTIGKHTCFFYCLMAPQYLLKKRKFGISEFELTFQHDINALKQWLKTEQKPDLRIGPYDAGIELITGKSANDFQRLEDALNALAKLPKSAVDIETNGLHPFFLKDPKIWTVAVGTFDRTVAFPLHHPEGWGTQSKEARVMGLLGDYLLNSGRKACHHLGMELEWFNYFLGADVLRRTEWDDTMALCHTLDERPGTKSLGHQTLLTFGFDLKAQSTLDVRRLLEYPLEKVLRYNGMDTKWTDALCTTKMPEILANPKYRQEYERKVRLAPTLVLTSAKGLPVDFKYARQQEDLLTKKLKSLGGKIQRCPEVVEYGQHFGIFSPTNPDHVLKLMQNICKRDEVRVMDERTKTVRWTSDEEALSRIPADQVPSAALILEHRGLSKLLSTYVLPVVSRKIVCPDGIIRPTYGSMVAVTGRLNAEEPNIQNWPKRQHKQIRGIIGSGPSKAFVALDYGQIEFRVVGMASGDPAIIDACWTGYDVHKHWAQRLVDIYPPQIDYIVDTFKLDWDDTGLKTLRQEMKNQWVFPQLFGSSLKGCADNLHLPEWVATDLHAEFWDTFSQTKKWQERLLASYVKNLYVETLGGRRRRGPMTKNEIINMPIQGTAADIVTAAMCVISEMAFERDDEHLQPALNVHDDLSFLIPDATESGLLDRIDLIATEMCRHRFDYINVPLVVEASIGVRWNELDELHVYRSNELFGLTQPGR